jgi:F-type H+-transporting ATPase subunit b
MKQISLFAKSGLAALLVLASPCLAAGAESGNQSVQAFVAMIVTQGLGFLVLYLILKRFAFGPVLRAMDARRERIASDFRQIEGGKEEIRKSKEDYEQRLARIEEEARIRIRDAIQEGQKLAEHVKLDAQKEAEAMLNKVRELIESERAKASVELRDQIVALTIAAAEKLIRERLDQEKHRQLISEFIDSMSSAQK